MGKSQRGKWEPVGDGGSGDTLPRRDPSSCCAPGFSRSLSPPWVLHSGVPVPSELQTPTDPDVPHPAAPGCTPTPLHQGPYLSLHSQVESPTLEGQHGFVLVPGAFRENQHSELHGAGRDMSTGPDRSTLGPATSVLPASPLPHHCLLPDSPLLPSHFHVVWSWLSGR